jgi:hypothetical protein
VAYPRSIVSAQHGLANLRPLFGGQIDGRTAATRAAFTLALTRAVGLTPALFAALALVDLPLFALALTGGRSRTLPVVALLALTLAFALALLALFTLALLTLTLAGGCARTLLMLALFALALLAIPLLILLALALLTLALASGCSRTLLVLALVPLALTLALTDGALTFLAVLPLVLAHGAAAFRASPMLAAPLPHAGLLAALRRATFRSHSLLHRLCGRQHSSSQQSGRRRCHQEFVSHRPSSSGDCPRVADGSAIPANDKIGVQFRSTKCAGTRLRSCAFYSCRCVRAACSLCLRPSDNLSPTIGQEDGKELGMTYRVFHGPRGSQAISPLEKDRMLFKEVDSLDAAFAWARHLDGEGLVPLLIEGDDGTSFNKQEIAAALQHPQFATAGRR